MCVPEQGLGEQNSDERLGRAKWDYSQVGGTLVRKRKVQHTEQHVTACHSMSQHVTAFHSVSQRVKHAAEQPKISYCVSYVPRQHTS